MSSNLGKKILEDFLKNSRTCIQAIVRELHGFEGNKDEKVHLLKVTKNQADDAVFDGDHFFLRTSVEYSNPQLTVEEAQGIIAARLLEVCGNYFYLHGIHETSKQDLTEMCEMLKGPPQGKIFSFLLNTDDVEPDRYSINPLKESLMTSGQSAFPSAFVKTDNLRIDERFMKKYEGALLSRFEKKLIEYHLTNCKNSYVDTVDAVKYEHLKILSEPFGIDLCLPMMRMPLATLEKENTSGLLHHIIRETHKDYESIESVYNCMGRSMKKRTTLLTVPHSGKGFGSKRAARGRIYFGDTKLKRIRVTYKTTPLYPNAIDPDDTSIAKAEDKFSVDGDKLMNYDFRETPSSPQFILYSLGSPEDAVLWHGIGEFGASQLVKSYTSMRLACANDSIITNLKKYGIRPKIPLQFNLLPESIWFHPIHRNIDASIGCVENLEDLTKIGIRLEFLLTREYVR